MTLDFAPGAAAGAGAAAAPGEVTLEVDPPGRQRRWTVLIRLLLAFPLALWTGLVGFAAAFALIACWFAVLVTGRRPEGLATLPRMSVTLMARYLAYLLMVTDTFPPFSLSEADHYPVRVVGPDSGPGSRLSVFFRSILAIPAAVVYQLVIGGWLVTSPVIWIWTLITGRTPRAHHEASTAALRWTVRFLAYVYLLTDRYPRRLFGEPVRPARAVYTAADLAADAVPSGPGVLRLGRPARRLVVTYLVLGLIYLVYAVNVDATMVKNFQRGMTAGAAAGQGQGAAGPEAQAQAELLTHVPASLHSSCQPLRDTDPVNSPGELAALGCTSGPPEHHVTVLYRLYSDVPSTRAPYQRILTGAGSALSGPYTGCGDGHDGSGDWTNDAGQTGGGVACGVLAGDASGPETAFLTWTDDARHISAEIDSTQLRLPEVYQFWTGYTLIS